MSLDIYFLSPPEEKECVCETCGNSHKGLWSEETGHFNFTHNLVKMADACGLYDYLWESESNGILSAKDLIEPLKDGLLELESSPLHYQSFNPPNGWGSYDSFVKRLHEMLQFVTLHPDYLVSSCS